MIPPPFTSAAHKEHALKISLIPANNMHSSPPANLLSSNSFTPDDMIVHDMYNSHPPFVIADELVPEVPGTHKPMMLLPQSISNPSPGIFCDSSIVPDKSPKILETFVIKGPKSYRLAVDIQSLWLQHLNILHHSCEHYF